MKRKIEFQYVRSFEFCDKNHFWIVKGITILVALIAWFCREYFGTPNMEYVIGTATAVFVLCSGFGVSESYLRKRGLFHYWENKIVKVWLPSLIVLVVLSLIRGEHMLKWVTEYYVALKGNFMYVIFGGYIVFWVAFKFVQNRTARLLMLFGAAIVAFVFIPEEFSGVFSDKAQLLCFPVGVLVSQKVWKRKIRNYKGGGKFLLLITFAAMTAAGWYATTLVTIPYLSTLVKSVFYMAAAITILVLTWILRPVPVMGAFVPVGMASYMLYMLYDSVFELWKPNAGWRVFTLVVAILLVCAGVLTWLRELLIRWNKNLRRKGKTHLKGSM